MTVARRAADSFGSVEVLAQSPEDNPPQQIGVTAMGFEHDPGEVDEPPTVFCLSRL